MNLTVTDQTRAVIPGAIVKAESQATGAITQVKSTSSGSASLALAPGNYKLTVSAMGFQIWTTMAEIDSGRNVQLDAVLKIAQQEWGGPQVAGAPEIPLSPWPEFNQSIPSVIPRKTYLLRASFPAGISTPSMIESNRGIADTILFNGVILTGEGLSEGTPRIVSALAIANGEVLASGSDAEIKRQAGPHTRMQDLNGGFIIPGLNDAHLHLGGAGQTKLNVDLTGSKSLEEMLQRIQAKAKQFPAGHWLTGGGWDHTLWDNKTLPTRQDLDRVTGDHPAILERIDGHIAVANSAALKVAGISGQTKAPQGGAIDLDAGGNPTGILRDTEMEEVEKIIPPPTHEERRRGLELAIDDAASHGLTSVQDNSEWEDFLVYEELEKEGKLKVRISEWLPFNASVETLNKLRAHHDRNDRMLHTGMLKGFMDGSLGSRTAAMKAPYADDRANSGLPRYDQDKLDAMVVERVQAGFQMGFHAIGDRASAMALNAFQKADAVPMQERTSLGLPCRARGAAPRPMDEKANCPTNLRNRIEHAQVVDPADIQRFAKLGVIASMQPNHLLTDMNWAMDRLGPQRAAYSYAWKAFLDAGVVLAFGTDYPVEPVTPFRGLYAAVTRANEAGTKTHFPENKLTRAQALYAYTQGSANAEFEEQYKGKLVPGFEADLTLLDRNLLTCPASEILKTKVIETIVAGKPVYQAQP